MKFGKFLEEKSKPEWRLYYVDYKYLKQIIKQMKIAIQNQTQSKKDAEQRFTKSIELEIKKVNDFFLMIEKEVQGKLTALRQLLNKAKSFDVTQTKKQDLEIEIQNLSNNLTDLYEYTLVNYTAFRKILKKHDRHTDMVASPWFLARCKQQPFYSSSKQFGNMLVKLSNCCSVARTILGEDTLQSPLIDDGLPGVPECTRYWVKLEDVMRVKTLIVKHLPINMLTSSSSRFPRESTDSISISSCYYDNPETLELYNARVKRSEGAIAIRFRTYENGDGIFVERKTHHEEYSGSLRERFELKPQDVFDYIRGTYKLEDFVSYLEQEQEQSEEYIRSACNLFAEIQTEISKRQYVPTLRTTYNRTTFQENPSSPVQIAFDTNIQMIKENLKLENDGLWCKSDLEISEDDVHEFPYAVMEVKLPKGKIAPQWITELVNSELVTLALKYSKYTHGCAMLLPDLVKIKPSWINEFLPNDKLKKKEKDFETELEELSSEELHFNDDIWIEQKDHSVFDENQSLIDDGRNRFQSASLEDVQKILDARDKAKPSIFTKIQNLFDFDQQYVKDGKPIVSRMKIEPKTYFANERTFLQWMSFCVIIQGIGIALISFPSTNFVGLVSGVCFVAISIAFMAYSLFLFRLRSARIRNNQPGRYDDFWGPFTLFGVMTAAVLVNAILFISNQIYTLSEQTINDTYY